MSLVVWPAGRPVVRAHEHAFGSTEFDPRTTGDRRCSSLSGEHGILPVLCSGSDNRTAAAATIFHRLPGRGRPRRIPLARYRSWQWSQLHCIRDLQLLALDAGLPDATDLVDGDALTAARSRERAAALLHRNPDVDRPAIPFASTAGLERLDVIGDTLGVTITRS